MPTLLPSFLGRVLAKFYILAKKIKHIRYLFGLPNAFVLQVFQIIMIKNKAIIICIMQNDNGFFICADLNILCCCGGYAFFFAAFEPKNINKPGKADEAKASTASSAAELFASVFMLQIASLAKE